MNKPVLRVQPAIPIVIPSTQYIDSGQASLPEG